MNKHKMAKIIYPTYQTNCFKIIRSTFIICELPHAPVIFPISLGIFNCFENSNRAENFRQTPPEFHSIKFSLLSTNNVHKLTRPKQSKSHLHCILPACQPIPYMVLGTTHEHYDNINDQTPTKATDL